MDTFAVAVFATEEAARKAGNALRDLHKEAVVTVHAAAIVSKTEDGNVLLRQTAEEGPVGAATGALIGAIAGVLAGPAALATGAATGGAAALAGMAAGGAAGGLLGMTGDLVKSGIDSDFLEMVAVELSPGRSALIASVDESWTLPLDKAVIAKHLCMQPETLSRSLARLRTKGIAVDGNVVSITDVAELRRLSKQEKLGRPGLA